MQKKLKTHNKFSLSSKNDIAELQQALCDIDEKYPIILDFLELYCGYNTAVLSSNPYDISYAGGKRDVILTIKTLMRKDIAPDAVAELFNKM